MNFKYRTATFADKDNLQQLGLNAYGRFEKVLTEENWQKLYGIQSGENTYADLLKKSICFVCENEGRIVGMAFLILSGNPTQIFLEEWCYLRMVGVHTDFGGYGIAGNLTKMCIDYAKAAGEKTIALHTSEFMDAARHIYEKIGFRQLREIPPAFGKRYWLYTMELI